MEKQFVKGSTEWAFFMDYYKFIQKYNSADNEEWFQVLNDESKKLFKKYEKTSISLFAMKLINVHVEMVERKWEHEKKI